MLYALEEKKLEENVTFCFQSRKAGIIMRQTVLS